MDWGGRGRGGVGVWGARRQGQLAEQGLFSALPNCSPRTPLTDAGSLPPNLPRRSPVPPGHALHMCIHFGGCVLGVYTPPRPARSATPHHLTHIPALCGHMCPFPAIPQRSATPLSVKRSLIRAPQTHHPAVRPIYSARERSLSPDCAEASRQALAQPRSASPFHTGSRARNELSIQSINGGKALCLWSAGTFYSLKSIEGAGKGAPGRYRRLRRPGELRARSQGLQPRHSHFGLPCVGRLRVQPREGGELEEKDSEGASLPLLKARTNEMAANNGGAARDPFPRVADERLPDPENRERRKRREQPRERGHLV
ncbi:hypothetical protein SKAU_G00130200 [Synaphobranchus kaupii]|uniref:Uncharacterized protein n=1 Tax=Synaphobranchus kaupii TaxID=118154 RepID=A0A9Q1J296_SYNKA|nr:hypothetical protein SKAU_G00130200 [Synaphobranchus kaupii]